MKRRRVASEGYFTAVSNQIRGSPGGARSASERMIRSGDPQRNLSGLESKNDVKHDDVKPATVSPRGQKGVSVLWSTDWLLKWGWRRKFSNTLLLTREPIFSTWRKTSITGLSWYQIFTAQLCDQKNPFKTSLLRSLLLTEVLTGWDKNTSASSNSDRVSDTTRNLKTHIYTQLSKSADTEQSRVGLENFVVSWRPDLFYLL